MPRRSAARLLALAALLIEVTLGVVLVAHLPPTIKSSLHLPHAAATPASTPTPSTTPTPASTTAAAGTYWTCEANESDSGRVTVNATPPPGAVSSPLCDATYGEQQPGQAQPPLPSGIEIWRVPVGTFPVYIHCGVLVVNIVDPYDRQAGPSTWPGSHRLLYDVDWNEIPSKTC